MQMSTTQYVILGIFILFAIGGVVVFAGFGGSGGSGSNTIQVSMWGSVSPASISKIVEAVNAQKQEALKIDYQEFTPDHLPQKLVEALAAGVGPDIVIIPHTLFLKEKNKFTVMPWSLLSERTFRDTFLESGEVFLGSDGAYALPFVVDPLVLYWNRDIFSANNFSTPPVYWEDATAISEKVSDILENKTIRKSGIALGEFANIQNAKEIILTLAMQAGSNLIQNNAVGLRNTILDTPPNSDKTPYEQALSFYTDFSNPTSPKYSWNRSLTDAKSSFITGNLAMYVGFASEFQSIREKNPNLNFDVAPLPQAKGSDIKRTYANTYGLAILKNSKNSGGAYAAMTLLTSGASIKIISDSLSLPPVRRDMITTFPGTSYGDVFYQSAIWGKSPLDISPLDTSMYMQDMIESITSGGSSIKDAIQQYSNKIDELIRSN